MTHIRRCASALIAAGAVAMLTVGAAAAGPATVTKNYTLSTGDVTMFPWIPLSEPIGGPTNCAQSTDGVGGDCFLVAQGMLNLDVLDIQSGKQVATGVQVFSSASVALSSEKQFCGTLRNFPIPPNSYYINVFIGVAESPIPSAPTAMACGSVAPAVKGTVTASGTAISCVDSKDPKCPGNADMNRSQALIHVAHYTF